MAYEPQNLGTAKVRDNPDRSVPQSFVPAPAIRYLEVEDGDRLVFLKAGDGVRVEVVDDG